ncbi:MAG: hypothetical protein AB3N14_14500, partial [Flavobacteriaceae bacterium]
TEVLDTDYKYVHEDGYYMYTYVLIEMQSDTHVAKCRLNIKDANHSELGSHVEFEIIVTDEDGRLCERIVTNLNSNVLYLELDESREAVFAQAEFADNYTGGIAKKMLIEQECKEFEITAKELRSLKESNGDVPGFLLDIRDAKPEQALRIYLDYLTYNNNSYSDELYDIIYPRILEAIYTPTLAKGKKKSRLYQPCNSGKLYCATLLPGFDEPLLSRLERALHAIKEGQSTYLYDVFFEHTYEQITGYDVVFSRVSSISNVLYHSSANYINDRFYRSHLPYYAEHYYRNGYVDMIMQDWKQSTTKKDSALRAPFSPSMFSTDQVRTPLSLEYLNAADCLAECMPQKSKKDIRRAMAASKGHATVNSYMDYLDKHYLDSVLLSNLNMRLVPAMLDNISQSKSLDCAKEIAESMNSTCNSLDITDIRTLHLQGKSTLVYAGSTSSDSNVSVKATLHLVESRYMGDRILPCFEVKIEEDGTTTERILTNISAHSMSVKLNNLSNTLTLQSNFACSCKLALRSQPLDIRDKLTSSKSEFHDDSCFSSMLWEIGFSSGSDESVLPITAFLSEEQKTAYKNITYDEATILAGFDEPLPSRIWRVINLIAPFKDSKLNRAFQNSPELMERIIALSNLLYRSELSSRLLSFDEDYLAKEHRY